jgi:hypothetical protein
MKRTPRVCVTLLFAVGATLLLCWEWARADRLQIQFADWQATTPFTGARTSFTAVVSGDFLYVLGGLSASGSDFTLYDDVQSARFGNDGSIPAGAWRTLNSFATARSGLASTVYNGFLYVVGGFSRQGTLDDIQYAPIRSDGTLGAWLTSPYHLNIARSNHRIEVLTTSSGTPYLAAVAGVGEIGNDTVHFDEIEAAPIAADGSIGAWKLCPFHLKGGRSAPATVVAGRQLYVLGGWGDLLIEDVFKDVQHALIRDDGCVDPWHTNPYPLNTPAYGLAALLDSGTGTYSIVVLGGNAGQGTYFNTVHFAGIASDGDTQPWQFDPHQFQVPRWGHAAVRHHDDIYVIGGSQRAGSGFLNDIQFTKIGAH